VNGLRDAIQAHTADPSGVPAPAVTLYPGCDRTNNVCSGKFSNSDNFGGLRFMPVKNPFSGSSIV
ncbi:MAG: phage BR0599 family protein, partial [Planctomycetota bacterium]